MYCWPYSYKGTGGWNLVFRLLQYLRDICCNVRPNFQSPVSNLLIFKPSMTTELEWKNISFCGVTEVFLFCQWFVKQVVKCFQDWIYSLVCFVHALSKGTMYNMKATRTNIKQLWVIIIWLSFIHNGGQKFPINIWSIHWYLYHLQFCPDLLLPHHSFSSNLQLWYIQEILSQDISFLPCHLWWI